MKNQSWNCILWPLRKNFVPLWVPGYSWWSREREQHYQQSGNVQHFIVQLMHTTLKNVELLTHFKIRKAAPTCFGLQGNHHQGATAST